MMVDREDKTKTIPIVRQCDLLKFSHSFCFDLADTFSGYLEDMADFFQRIAVAVAQSVSQLDDFAFAIRQ
jgi:hypothetical protein